MVIKLGELVKGGLQNWSRVIKRMEMICRHYLLPQLIVLHRYVDLIKRTCALNNYT